MAILRRRRMSSWLGRGHEKCRTCKGRPASSRATRSAASSSIGGVHDLDGAPFPCRAHRAGSRATAGPPRRTMFSAESVVSTAVV